MNLYRRLFDHAIRRELRRGTALLSSHPESASALGHILGHQSAAEKQRKRLESEVLIPPLLIISTTEQCNLHCEGCYARALHQQPRKELTRPQMGSLLAQAVDAGCSALLLAGGEPLLCPNWLESAAAHPELLTLVFTNGTLLDEAMVELFACNRSLLPVISIEGGERATDARRGDGVGKQVQAALQCLHRRNIPFGLSVTVSRENIDAVTAEDFLAPFITMGCRLAIFVEYVPVDDASKALALSPEGKKRLYWSCKRRRVGALRLAFPGNEKLLGGCLAAGRGFVHISASGDVEPCPFAGHADRNITSVPLIEALKSPLLSRIREKHALLQEGAAGGCALRGEAAMEFFEAIK
ncbi:MAG: radical SAM protein [Firmicutes bacterium]|nr:radical SAM protein [Bacillota bacterium]